MKIRWRNSKSVFHSLLHLSVKFGIAHSNTVNSDAPSTSILQSESIEWFLEDQAFSLSYDLAPHQPLPLYRQQVFSFLGLTVCRRSSSRTGSGTEGVGKEPNHTTARKPGPLEIIQYSLHTTMQYAVVKGGGGDRVGDPFLEILCVVYRSL